MKMTTPDQGSSDVFLSNCCLSVSFLPINLFFGTLLLPLCPFSPRLCNLSLYLATLQKLPSMLF